MNSTLYAALLTDKLRIFKAQILQYFFFIIIILVLWNSSQEKETIKENLAKMWGDNPDTSWKTEPMPETKIEPRWQRRNVTPFKDL